MIGWGEQIGNKMGEKKEKKRRDKGGGGRGGRCTGQIDIEGRRYGGEREGFGVGWVRVRKEERSKGKQKKEEELGHRI